MATQRSSWEKRERDKAKRARADAKRARRQDRKVGDEDEEEAEAEPRVDQESILAELAALHAAFADDQIDFDEFEERKAELTAKLSVE